MSAVVERTTTKSAEPTSRMAILKAATEEFALKGYAGARTEGIANAAGVNHTLLFYHFKTKEQLYSAVLDTVFSEWNDRVSRALDLESSAKERLLAYVDSYFDFIAEFPLSPKLVQQEHMRQSSTGSDQLHRMVERYVRPVHRKLVALLKEGVCKGEFDVDIAADGDFAARLIVAVERHFRDRRWILGNRHSHGGALVCRRLHGDLPAIAAHGALRVVAPHPRNLATSAQPR